jgi:hypothetical protein
MGGSEDDVSPAMDRERLRDCALRQIQEIDKYKWYLGERLGHDPLQDRSYNDIAREWVRTHAADFRVHWTEQERGAVQADRSGQTR